MQLFDRFSFSHCHIDDSFAKTTSTHEMEIGRFDISCSQKYGGFHFKYIHSFLKIIFNDKWIKKQKLNDSTILGACIVIIDKSLVVSESPFFESFRKLKIKLKAKNLEGQFIIF